MAEHVAGITVTAVATAVVHEYHWIPIDGVGKPDVVTVADNLSPTCVVPKVAGPVTKRGAERTAAVDDVTESADPFAGAFTVTEALTRATMNFPPSPALKTYDVPVAEGMALQSAGVDVLDSSFSVAHANHWYEYVGGVGKLCQVPVETVTVDPSAAVETASAGAETICGVAVTRIDDVVDRTVRVFPGDSVHKFRAVTRATRKRPRASLGTDKVRACSPSIAVQPAGVTVNDMVTADAQWNHSSASSGAGYPETGVESETTPPTW